MGREMALTFPRRSRLRIRTFNSYKSIVETPTSDDLPAFTLITGENGAGKTHLLESMRELVTQWVDFDYGNRRPRMLSTADLQATDGVIASHETHEQRLNQFREQITQQLNVIRGRPDARELLSSFVVNIGLLSAEALSSLEVRSGKWLGDWTAGDFERFTPIETGRRDLFSVSMADVFSTYTYLHTINGFKRFRAERFGDDVEFVEEEAFAELYGSPPWDALNEVLADVGMRYGFERPEPFVLPPYPQPRLVDLDSGYDVPVAELSSGEKTLLTIALAAYSADHRRLAIEKPAVILLDEPDAALHPSMVRSLIHLASELIVGRLGVPVIMTTHSPTTVALADESSLHLMSRSGSPRLVKATKDLALRSLLVGVPTLSVRSEHRRTVVVESPIDERRYSKMHMVLSSRIGSERSLQFMAAGGNGRADGCDAVIDLVDRLRGNGNDLVYGLVDRDYRRAEPAHAVVFDGSRHSMENVLLDPLPLALLMLEDRHRQLIDRFPALTTTSVGPEHAQELVDWITTAVGQDGDDRMLRESQYAEGLRLQVETFWFELRGHNLNDRIVEAVPELRSHGDRLGDDIIAHVWFNHPWAVPKSTIDLFERLLSDA